MAILAPPGCGHGAYVAALERVVLPAVYAFRPEIVLVSCGFDASASDPLGRMLCHSETFREMAKQVKRAARELCGGRLVFCHEGGYSPTYVPFCGLAVIEELAGERTEATDPLAGWYSRIGGQELQPHQADLLERAAEQLASLPIMSTTAV